MSAVGAAHRLAMPWLACWMSIWALRLSWALRSSLKRATMVVHSRPVGPRPPLISEILGISLGFLSEGMSFVSGMSPLPSHLWWRRCGMSVRLILLISAALDQILYLCSSAAGVLEPVWFAGLSLASLARCSS